MLDKKDSAGGHCLGWMHVFTLLPEGKILITIYK
ncbi:Uncharacterised protein [Sphingobacterium thalpophilum]|uniref:Uncharacterized protein n=1 Tax=Sphingobacterium thalpophilum TaxID=259 RepID=A0A4U9VBD6_9SPHI|nr:Uncharacterised protein [Sphingobacterium thalpophilum]